MVHGDPAGSPGAAGGRGERDSVRKQVDILRALEDSESKYRDLFNSIPDVILVANPQRKITDCNEAFTQPFGCQLEKIAGLQTSAVYASEEEYQDLERAQHERAGKENFFSPSSTAKRAARSFPAGSSGKLLLAAGTPAVVGHCAGGPKIEAGAP